MDVKWIDHKGYNILYVDYRGANGDNDTLMILKRENEILKECSNKTLVLVNYEKTYASKKYMEEVKKFGKEIGKDKILKSALLGIDHVKKILVQSYILFTGDSKIKMFDREEDAKDWLVQDI